MSLKGDMMKKTGKLAYTLKNNYLFLALMNSHPYTLKMLVCSLLALESSEITSITIRNPIKVGEAVTDKTFILDLDLMLNGDTYINIELQVVNYNNWPERSLGFLCRTYDNLNKGEDYIDTKPAIHISILDFTLFEEYAEFFATYRLLNCKKHYEYTSKFSLHVLDLSKIDMATDEDKRNQLDVWSRIFQAETWGDLMAIAADNNDFVSTIEEIDRLTADEAVRLQCEAQERALIHEQAIKRKLKTQESKIEQLEATLNSVVQEKDAALQEQAEEINRLRTMLAQMNKI